LFSSIRKESAGGAFKADYVLLSVDGCSFVNITSRSGGGGFMVSHGWLNMRCACFLDCVTLSGNEVLGNAVSCERSPSLIEKCTVMRCAPQESGSAKGDSSIAVSEAVASFTDCNSSRNHGDAGGSGIAVYHSAAANSSVRFNLFFEEFDNYAIVSVTNAVFDIKFTDFVKTSKLLSVFFYTKGNFKIDS
jgi:hypothetical protein